MKTKVVVLIAAITLLGTIFTAWYLLKNTDATKHSSNRGERRASIIIPSDWQRQEIIDSSHKLKISMMLPPNYELYYDPNVTTLIRDKDQIWYDTWKYKSSIAPGGCNTYEGESRRQWFQNYLNGSFDKYFLFDSPRPKFEILSIVENEIAGGKSYLIIETLLSDNYQNRTYLYSQNGVINLIEPINFFTPPREVLTADMDKIFFSLVTDSPEDTKPLCSAL